VTATPYSYRTYTGGAAGITFAVNFPFIARAHVSVYTQFEVIDGTYEALLVQGADYQWVSDSQILMLTSTAGKQVTIIRSTPTAALVVDWADGSNVNMDELKLADRQVLYAVQEQNDKTVVAAFIANTGGDNAQQVATLTTQVATLTTQLQALATGQAALTTSLGLVNQQVSEVERIALASAAVGDVKYTSLPAPPPGWIEANGAILNRSDYPELFAAIGSRYGNGNGSTTFQIPDYRGVFLRGLDAGRGLDAARSQGTLQQDQNKTQTINPTASHNITATPNLTATHNITAAGSFAYNQNTTGTGTGRAVSDITGIGFTETVDIAISGGVSVDGGVAINGGVTVNPIQIDGGTEARVKNVAERAIIKAFSRLSSNAIDPVNVRLLLHLQSNFANSSQYATVPAFDVPAPGFTAPAKFGAGSPLFLGGLAGPRYAIESLPYVWTAETWAYVARAGNARSFFMQIGTVNDQLISLDYYDPVPGSDYFVYDALQFEAQIPFSFPLQLFSAHQVFTFGQWTHIAVSVNNAALTVFVNGAIVISATIPVGLLTGGSSPSLRVGATMDNTPPGPGVRIQEFRLVRNQAVYSGAFVPPRAPY
jgi:microcystin-dependent protein